MKFKFKYFFILVLSLMICGLDAPLSWAQSEVLTNSSNTRNQFHRNLLGNCSTTSIDCGPRTFDGGNPAPDPLFGFMTNVNAALPNDTISPALSDSVTCVAGAFGEAAGNAPGTTPTNADNCLTTGGFLWPGFSNVNPRCDVPSTMGIVPECLAQFSDRFAFTGLPRIPTGADTQFGTGAPGAAPDTTLTGSITAVAGALTATCDIAATCSQLTVGDIVLVGNGVGDFSNPDHVKRVRDVTGTTLTVDTAFETVVTALPIAKSDRTFTNVMDIGGALNDSFVPAGSSDATIAFTVQRTFQDVPTAECTVTTIGNGLPTPSVCNSGFDLTSSAPPPGNIPAGTCIGGPCPATFVGNRFQSAVATGDPVCEAVAPGTFCRKNEIEYGFTLKFVNGIIEAGGDCAEGSTVNPAFGGCARGVGQEMQETKVSFRVISFTDSNGDLLSSPTGFYFHQLNAVGATDVNSAAARTILSEETGAFRTAVTFPGGLPSIALELDQTAPFDFAVDDGCQHDSNGLSCSPRIDPNPISDPLLP